VPAAAFAAGAHDVDSRSPRGEEGIMRLVVARIGRAHGLRGEVTVEVHTDVPERRFVRGAVLHVPDGGRQRELAAAGRPTTLTVTGARNHNGILLLTFAEVPDRTVAEALRDVLLEADVPEADDVVEPDAWYEHQLVGLSVVDPAGTQLGEVVGLQDRPAQDLLVVRTPAGERLVPFVHALVPVVDPVAGRVVVDAPPGLLDDVIDESGPQATV
jgi:16S rRNA processing protein RimM